jgi:hypothetical protein
MMGVRSDARDRTLMAAVGWELMMTAGDGVCCSSTAAVGNRSSSNSRRNKLLTRFRYGIWEATEWAVNAA